jgi:hypothetical protein
VRATILFLAALAGCAVIHPQPSDACAEGDAICQPGGGSAIVCRSGRYEKTACGGPSGCAMQPDRTVRCDQSRGAQEGTPCAQEYQGRGQCSPNGDARLSCSSGWWKREACPEGSTCQVSPVGVSCMIQATTD